MDLYCVIFALIKYMFNFTIETDISASSQCKPVGFHNKLLGDTHRHAGRQGY